MKFAIKVNKLPKEPGYIAQVDWNKGDAGQVGTPGAIGYGSTIQQAYSRLEIILKEKGHEIINTSL